MPRRSFLLSPKDMDRRCWPRQELQGMDGSLCCLAMAVGSSHSRQFQVTIRRDWFLVFFSMLSSQPRDGGCVSSQGVAWDETGVLSRAGLGVEKGGRKAITASMKLWHLQNL